MDVLAAQVRAALGKGLVAWSAIDEALAALDALVARVKEADERAEAHLLLRKEAAAWAEEVEAERDALVARVTEAERRADVFAQRREMWEKSATAAHAALADARNALELADREASIAHDAIWSKEVAPTSVLHDNDRQDSAQAAIWRIHGVVREVLARLDGNQP